MIAMTWWNRPGLEAFDAIVCDGSVRSGKTLATVVGFFLWSMASFDGQFFGICGKTVGALRRNIVVHLADWLGGAFRITEHRSENKLTVTDCRGCKNTYYLFGGQDESAYALIQGVTLAGALLDEAVLMPRSFVDQACARCSVAGSKIWFSCNPASKSHWFYESWVQGAAQKNALHLHFTMADNPGLDGSVRQRYRRLYTGHFYKRYVLGLWCNAQGLVYEFDEKWVTESLPKTGRYYISVDYGVQNPFSAGLWCVNGGRAYRVKEFYYDGRKAGRQRTDAQYVSDLEALAGDLPVEAVIIDPSAASLIAALRQRGRFRVRKAKNAVLPGIRLVARLLQEGRLLFAPGCRDAIREFGLYSWEEGEDRPKKQDDHAMDDIRYFCATVLGRIDNYPTPVSCADTPSGEGV